MNDTEQLIKDALGKLAERTPHPGPTLNALRRKHKRQRNNIFLIATAGVAAVAVLVFGGLVASDRYAPPTGGDAAAALVPDAAGGIALEYAPHWLPDGFVEGARGVSGGLSARVWVPSNAPVDAGDGGGPSVSVGSTPDHPDTTGWQEVSVRGLKGHLRVEGQTATVAWKAQDVVLVSVREVGDVRETALRVADSVRADAKLAYQPAFRLNGQPAARVGGTGPADWVARADTPARVQVSPRTPQLGGSRTPVSVRGKQGFVENGDVVVRDGDVWIIATGDLPVDELVAAVNQVELLKADTSWIRKR
ncbi:hypothetical protein [Lentzea jiangxiensis]|uniref:Uncharacterized protein n=1 Tax=Lentzea jiangxiensis TaxID=641025 RepID=A0A1H0F3Y2_9PSEU|nr:hypothetical protein [Lentzea jiangxiensis]SDN89263.1 hypothetical protein SAMN05421507_101625 [Lentzea jiangxiensis]